MSSEPQALGFILNQLGPLRSFQQTDPSHISTLKSHFRVTIAVRPSCLKPPRFQVQSPVYLLLWEKERKSFRGLRNDLPYGEHTLSYTESRPHMKAAAYECWNSAEVSLFLSAFHSISVSLSFPQLSELRVNYVGIEP